jgi:hypothetical protein
MATTVFYAWQSDRDGKVCHYFIRDALTDALDKLNSTADVEEADAFDVELDHDRKGVPGHPHIAETIKQKIAKCAIFVADLTHVAQYQAHDDRRKHAQNANVLIELGLAIRYRAWERIILVMNTAFGAPADLPFDLQHHSYPIQYDLPNTTDPTKTKSERKKLSDALATQLKSMLTAIAADERAAKSKVMRRSCSNDGGTRKPAVSVSRTWCSRGSSSRSHQSTLFSASA